jgi:predicted kinase
MSQPNEKLPDGVPPEADELLERLRTHFPQLRALQRFRRRGIPLDELARRTFESLRRSPPPQSQTPPEHSPPWWQSGPATCQAAVFCHVGLGVLDSPKSSSPEALPPHAAESAQLAREILRHLEVPFTVREHALALIRNFRRPENLVGSGSPDETYLRLACTLDLRCLHALKLTELQSLPEEDGETVEKQQKRLATFRERAESLSIFGLVPASPLPLETIREHGFSDAETEHRMVNALRFLRLKAGIDEADTLRDRLQAPEEKRGRKVHLLVGPAGSGKSSWARENLDHTRIVSSDQMREELTGDPSDQSQNYLVFERCMTRVRHFLEQGEPVTFDATNYREDLRDQPVQTARWCGAEIHSYYFDIPLETALDRNQSRPRRVPEHVIRRHYRLMTPPALYESDQHHVVDQHGHCTLYWPPKPSS